MRYACDHSCRYKVNSTEKKCDNIITIREDYIDNSKKILIIEKNSKNKRDYIFVIPLFLGILL